MKVNPRNVERFLRGAFSLKKNQECVDRSAASHINLQEHCLQDAFYLRKHTESGRVSATHVLVAKRYAGAVGRHSYEFTVTRNAICILLERTLGIWGEGLVQRAFFEKHNDFSGVGGE